MIMIEEEKLKAVLKAAVELVCSEFFEAETLEERNLERALIECGMIEQAED